jgi:hypothetical protein
MLKKLIAGFILLVAGMAVVSMYHGAAEHSPSHTPASTLEPVDRALAACEDWTQKNSKLAVGEIVKEYELTGGKLHNGHHAVGIDYCSKGDGILMKSRCEYTTDGTSIALVKAESSLK